MGKFLNLDLVVTYITLAEGKVKLYIKVRNKSDQKIRKQKKVLLKFVCKKLFQFFEKQLYISDYISNHDKTGLLTISMICK